MAKEGNNDDFYPDLCDSLIDINKMENKLIEEWRNRERDANQGKVKEEIIETIKSSNKLKKKVIPLTCIELLRLKIQNVHLKIEHAELQRYVMYLHLIELYYFHQKYINI